jgi:hypothetical protein
MNWICFPFRSYILKYQISFILISPPSFHFPVTSPLATEMHSSIHQWLYNPLLGPGLFFTFVIFLTQTVGLLGRVIITSQGRYLHTGQHKHRINPHIDIHALNEFRTYDPIVQASEDSSCLRPRGHGVRPYCSLHEWSYNTVKVTHRINLVS